MLMPIATQGATLNGAVQHSIVDLAKSRFERTSQRVYCKYTYSHR